MTREQVLAWLGENIERLEASGVRVERVLLLLPDGETVSWHRPQLERRDVQEVKPIPHAGKCACGQPAQVLRYEQCADGSVAAVYAARRWFGALYPACGSHADAGVILPGKVVRPS